jgi:flagellar FliL protein
MSGTAAMADEETTRQEDEPSGKRRVILIAASAVLLVAIGIGLWFSGILSHRFSSATRAQSAAAEKPALVDVPDIITNLDNGSRRAVFVKLKARIEVAHSSDQAIIATNMPQILDAFQTYLRSMRPEELHGAEGTYRLREALMNRIDIIAAPVQVLDVLFAEMIIQ